VKLSDWLQSLDWIQFVLNGSADFRKKDNNRSEAFTEGPIKTCFTSEFRLNYMCRKPKGKIFVASEKMTKIKCLIDLTFIYF